jgi:Glyoxalase superfamily protein
MEDGGRGSRESVIPILRVADASNVVAWYARLGFHKESEHRFGPGMPAFVMVARGNVRIFLSETVATRSRTIPRRTSR